MRVLVTNDDGIEAPGLHHLAAALDDAGYDVLVVAPNRDYSGYGSALGSLDAGSRLKASVAAVPGAPAITAWALDGPPALCVLAARLGGFGEPPDLVASGINAGHNTGRAVLYSGTIGAALAGANMGVSGLAISTTSAGEHLATTAEVGVAAIDWLATAPARTVVNLNVPDLPPETIKGCRWASLAPLGTAHASIRPGPVVDGQSELTVDLVKTAVELPADSDTVLVRSGYVAVTCLAGVRADDWLPVAAEIDRRLVARATQRRVRPPAGETA